MKALSLLRERVIINEAIFVELVVWKLPMPSAGSPHEFKYRLALVHDGVCVMRYDNEAGKGDHKHVSGVELDYQFVSVEQLQRDFWDDVERWRQG